MFSVTFFSCNSNETGRDMNNPKYEVDIDALKKEDLALVSSYFKSVRPIFLETKENCLIQSISGIQVTDDYIFILDRKYKRLYCFDKEGKFVRRIGNLGSGPAEFSNISDFTIDRDGTIYIVDPNSAKIYAYTLLGKYISSFQLKDIGGYMVHIQVVGDFLYLDFEAEKIKLGANAPLLLKVDKRSGEVVDKYLSVNEHNLGFPSIASKDRSFFYSKNNHTPYYASRYSNTVFSLDNSVEPYFRINSKRLLQKEDFEGLNFSSPRIFLEINGIRKIKSIYDFQETKNYIFCGYFNESITGIDILLYCKNTGKAKLYGAFFDDYFYNTATNFIMPFFGCSDEEGLYAFIPVESMSFFLDVYKSGGIKYELGKKQHNHITKLSEEMNPLLFYYELKD